MNKKAFLLLCFLWPALSAMAQMDHLVFTPQWLPQAQFAGYYVAQEKGFFKEAQLDVEIVHPTASEPALTRIKEDKSQATTLQLMEAMELCDFGIPLVNILQTSMNNSLMIVSRRGVSPLEQKGARVGVWSAGFGQLAYCMSIKEGLDYEWIPIASNINLFISGALDATLAMSYNEYYQLVQTGLPITEETVYRFREHGYNIQEDGVYVTKTFYDEHPDLCKRFADACKRGWEWAAEHPDETLEIVMDVVKKNHVATNRILQKLMLEEILRQLVNEETGQREYRLRKEIVEQANQLMLDNNLIFDEVTYDQLLDLSL